MKRFAVAKLCMYVCDLYITCTQVLVVVFIGTIDTDVCIAVRDLTLLTSCYTSIKGTWPVRGSGFLHHTSRLSTTALQAPGCRLREELGYTGAVGRDWQLKSLKSLSSRPKMPEEEDASSACASPISRETRSLAQMQRRDWQHVATPHSVGFFAS